LFNERVGFRGSDEPGSVVRGHNYILLGAHCSSFGFIKPVRLVEEDDLRIVHPVVGLWEGAEFLQPR
jgi:hypothetical protein